MGCSSACAVFEVVTTAFGWVLRNKFILNPLHYLDDFAFIQHTFDQCEYDLNVFKTVSARIGIPLAPEKTEGLARDIMFLGFRLQTNILIVSVPPDKMIKYAQRVEAVLQADSISLDQSLLGCLNWTLSIIIPGWAFLRCMYDAMIGKSLGSDMILITREMKSDLEIWQHFINTFNGRACISYVQQNDPNVIAMHADACHKPGAGVFGHQ